MRASSALVAVASSEPTVKTVSVFEFSWQQILEQVRFTWPKKTAERLASITGASVRTCYRWLRKGRPTQPDAIQTLAILSALRDEHARRGRLLEQFELFAASK